jgi:hypothetical protein
MTCAAPAQSKAPAKGAQGPWFGTFKQQGAGQDGPTLRFDGKLYPEKGDPTVDAFALKIVDDHTYELTDMKDGKVTTKAHITFSSGGKLRTSHTTGFDITGRPVDRVVVWERVGP